MSLIEILKTSPEQIAGKHIQQIISFAGEGKLRDGNITSAELREYLAAISSDELDRHANECLTTPFTDSGMALQDIINQVGSRLGFKVRPGRYRGVSSEIGYDGLWEAPDPEGNAIVVEVKTTDAYQVALDKPAGYRHALVDQGAITEEESSILVVVGRNKTPDLEAQIRGSRHAWDVRLVSVDSLLACVHLKEEAEDPEIPRRIRQILVPQEFTRIDGIIELVFSTTKDLKQEQLEADAEDDEGPKFVPVKFHEECAARIQRHLGINLVRKSRATYVSPDERTAVVCAISKEHEKSGYAAFWFAVHPHQLEILEQAEIAYIGFGCGSAERIVLFPFAEFRGWLDGFNQTTTQEGRSYWHVHLFDEGDKFTLHRKKDADDIDVTQYALPRGEKSQNE